MLQREMRSYARDRYNKGHYDGPSAGSVFKNDRRFGRPSGEIIDSLGLRGYRIGGAKVSDKHANIFINAGAATATDFRRLIDMVRDRVRDAYGFELEREVQYVGRLVVGGGRGSHARSDSSRDRRGRSDSSEGRA